VEKLAADIREFNELHCGDELTVPNFSVIGPEEYMRWSNAVDYQIARYREKNDKLTQEMRYADTMLENDVDNYIRRSKQGESFDKRLLEIKKRIGLCQKKKEALVVVDNDNLSLAIGKKGLNVRLASRLTHHKLDIKTTEEAKEMGINIA